MTFDEALKLKRDSPVSFRENGTLYITKIVPVLVDDRINYLSDFKHNDLSDEDAKSYSTNNDFEVIGLSCVAYNVSYIGL